MRQRRWLELLVDYALKINYHPGKVNNVADALSQKTQTNMGCILTYRQELLRELDQMEIEVCVYGKNTTLATLLIHPSIIGEIKIIQVEDKDLQYIMERMKNKKETDFSIKENGSLWYKERLCIPDKKELKKNILREAHSTPYTAHPGSTKMYQDLKSIYWWINMKIETIKYVAQCLTCQQVKVKHQKPGRTL